MVKSRAELRCLTLGIETLQESLDRRLGSPKTITDEISLTLWKISSLHKQSAWLEQVLTYLEFSQHFGTQATAH